MAVDARPLWSCPRCGAKLLSRGLSHSCGRFSVARFLKGRDSRERALFGRFVALVAACGPYEVAPAKTRVAFLVKVRFASVNRLGPGGMEVHFVLPRQLPSTRLRRIDRVGRLFVHHLRVLQSEELDAEVGAWLRESYRDYGERRWLRKGLPPAVVPPAGAGAARRTRGGPRRSGG
jgi:hypothetical protein